MAIPCKTSIKCCFMLPAIAIILSACYFKKVAQPFMLNWICLAPDGHGKEHPHAAKTDRSVSTRHDGEEATGNTCLVGRTY
jgi:hypothetical protein